MRVSLYNVLRVRLVMPIALRTGNAVTNSTACGLNFNTQRFRTVMLVFLTGTITDGSLALTVEESADGTTGWTAIPAARFEGAVTAVALTDDDKVYEYGVIPDSSKPFLRAVATQTTATTGGTFGAAFILGSPDSTPVVRP